MILIPKKDTKCEKCLWAGYLNADCILGSGYICRLNPFLSVAMGIEGKHSERKRNIDAQKDL